MLAQAPGRGQAQAPLWQGEGPGIAAPNLE